MEQFLGKWKEVKEGAESHRRFLEKIGVPEEIADKIIKYTAVYETVKDGDLIKMVSSYLEDPNLNKTYNFKLNETFTDTDNFGQKFTVFCEIKNGKWYDKCSGYYNDATIESVQEVVGDTLIVKTTCDGTSMVTKFKKQSE
ncbi:uncharacterized protein LOC115223512 [Octopus sinensis]|uniref:Uncharacterized protein LOC115223512 n=1 Tax=Octopus sinensis TaxID=2607531 RepID=A0A6P7TFF7_9MOLL|nr:uncharacterized protein LOC115223512 [Octopus sinensis]